MFKWLSIFSFIEYCTCYWTGAAMVASSVISGAMSSKSAKDAGKASSKATAASNDMLQAQMLTNTGSYRPYTDLGEGASAKLSYLLGIGSKTDKYSVNDFANYNSDYAPSWYQGSGGQRNDTNLQYNDYLKSIQGGRAPNLGPDRLYQNDDLSNHGFRTLNDYTGQEYGGLLNGFTEADLNKDVVYNKGLEFGLNEGVKGLNRQAAAAGGLGSGATLKALTRYANDYGTTKASGASDRFNQNKLNVYNMLSGTAGQGLSAVNGLAGNNTNLVSGQSNNTMANGTNQGNAAVASGAAWGNAINGGIGNYLYNQRTQQQPANAPVVSNSYLPNYNNSAGSIPWYAMS